MEVNLLIKYNLVSATVLLIRQVETRPASALRTNVSGSAGARWRVQVDWELAKQSTAS